MARCLVRHRHFTFPFAFKIAGRTHEITTVYTVLGAEILIRMYVCSDGTSTGEVIQEHRSEGWDERIRRQLIAPRLRGLLQKLTVAHLVNKFPALIKPQVSQPWSEERTAGPYHEPVESSPPSHLSSL